MLLIKPLAIAAAITVAATGAQAAGHKVVLDLTHAIGTFAPKDGNIAEPDLTKPYKDSIAVPTFGAQAVFETLPDFKTNRGHFGLGRFLLAEHHGTHVDAPVHYNNNAQTLETKTPDRRTLEELGMADLYGPIAFIDISARVSAELDKNGGKPGPKAVTDFSNASPNVVTAADIDAIADQLGNGTWVMANAGWSKFFSGANMAESPYINGWNFPGFSEAACDRLIELEESKGIRINGLVMDNIGVDSGENGAGPKGDLVTDSWACHVRGLQRGWKFVENAANLGQLSQAGSTKCDLMVGAPKLVAGSGGPSRVVAICDM